MRFVDEFQVRVVRVEVGVACGCGCGFERGGGFVGVGVVEGAA